MPLPIFHISCFQEFVDEIEKAFVGNLLPKQAQEDSVVDGVEVAFEISLDGPGGSSAS